MHKADNNWSLASGLSGKVLPVSNVTKIYNQIPAGIHRKGSYIYSTNYVHLLMVLAPNFHEYLPSLFCQYIFGP